MLHSFTNPTARRVLVAEDDPSLRSVLDELLKLKDYQVTCVTDGEAAYAAAQRIQPRMIVTDLTMPVGRGFSRLARLRQDPQLKGVPVIVSSAHGPDDNQVECGRLYCLRRSSRASKLGSGRVFASAGNPPRPAT